MFIIDNFLDTGEASAFQAEILALAPSEWDRYDNPFERKWTLRNKNLKIFDVINSDEFIADLETQFGCRLARDDHRVYWGVHIFDDGDFLAMHLDSCVHPIQKLKKHVTVGLYLSKDWKPENGGALVFDDGTSILPDFNTLVAFENTRGAWHGSPFPVSCPNGERRIFVTASFMAPDIPPFDTREKALFRLEKGERNYLKKRLIEMRADGKSAANMYKWDRKVVVSITGIRPDFIRMKNIFKQFDEKFFHILVHTGQHYDPLLSGVFFDERKPDFILDAGRQSTNHFEQLAYVSTEIPRLFREEGIRPDWIVLLGDSNTVGVSFPLKKEGYKIAHVEAGMRSGDRRMLEEINRTVCDHCSDALFVYHDDYRENLARENITKNVFVVGNTIVEEAARYSFQEPKHKDGILVDIHRPENFNDKERLRKIIEFANDCEMKYKVPVRLLYFKRLVSALEKFNIDMGQVRIASLMPHREYLETVYHSLFIISDSGTGQEEPALLGTQVIVPREFTERPQSYKANCSFRLALEPSNFAEAHEWIGANHPMDTSWLGDGTTSEKVAQILAGLQ